MFRRSGTSERLRRVREKCRVGALVRISLIPSRGPGKECELGLLSTTVSTSLSFSAVRRRRLISVPLSAMVFKINKKVEVLYFTVLYCTFLYVCTHVRGYAHDMMHDERGASSAAT